MKQIPLNLRPRDPYQFANFHVLPGNKAAVEMLQAPERWAAPVLLLLGPTGSGKTHLGTAWAQLTAAPFIDAAHQSSEMDLFAAINRALSGKTQNLLLASHLPLTEWSINMPDLRSRLQATPIVHLAEHDEASLELILRALFMQNGREVGQDVVAYILRHAPRSVEDLRVLVQGLDEAAGSKKADLTKAFVAKYMRNASDV